MRVMLVELWAAWSEARSREVGMQDGYLSQRGANDEIPGSQDKSAATLKS